MRGDFLDSVGARRILYVQVRQPSGLDPGESLRRRRESAPTHTGPRDGLCRCLSWETCELPHNLSEITDVAVPGTDLEDVIGSMHKVARRALSCSAVAMELTPTRRKTPYWRSLTSLAHEVAHDKCSVFFNERRELRRIVCARLDRG